MNNSGSFLIGSYTNPSRISDYFLNSEARSSYSLNLDSYLFLSTDHNDFRAKFLHFMSELWIDPEVSLIMSVGEPSDFLSDDAVISDNDTIVSLPGFHLVILICRTSDKVLGSILFSVMIRIPDTRYPNM